MTGKPVSVGIIPNPASGTDIRRLVAMGSVFGTQDKINIVQRILIGLDGVGVERVVVMPDAFAIGREALNKLPSQVAELRERVQLLDMPVENAAGDSMHAARRMREMGVGCIVVLGGDGTTRMVARGCGDVPLLPVSTGTNNVIPYLVEGTIAGLAAGFVARYPEALAQVAYRSKRLEIVQDGKEPDMALVDVAVVTGERVGTRAVWDPRLLRQVIVTRGEPWATGFSSVAGFSTPVTAAEPRGLWFQVGEPRVCRVTVPLAPGLIVPLGIQDMGELAIGDSVTVAGGKTLLALDGEREVLLHKDQSARVILRDDGPWIVDVYRAAQEATRRGMFVQWTGGRDSSGGGP